MKSIIKELCWTHPGSDRLVEHTEEYESLRQQRGNHEQKFIESLRKETPELVKEYLALESEFGAIQATAAEDAFLKGFRLGLLLMAEAAITI